jgi:hypothetical protein
VILPEEIADVDQPRFYHFRHVVDRVHELSYGFEVVLSRGLGQVAHNRYLGGQTTQVIATAATAAYFLW